MTDKEKRIFEEWFEEKKENYEVYGNGDDFWVDDEIKKFCLMGYEQGLKAGRPQWHDLRKAPDDLPNKELEEKQLVVRVRNYEEDYIFAYYMLDKYYSKNGKRFYSDISCDYPIYIKDIIAWCEIPTFDKE